MTFLLYIFLILPKIGVLFTTLATLAIVVFVFQLMDTHVGNKIPKKYFFIGLIFCSLSILTPSKTDTYILGTAILSEKALQSDIGQKGLRVIEQQLDELLEKKKK